MAEKKPDAKSPETMKAAPETTEQVTSTGGQMAPGAPEVVTVDPEDPVQVPAASLLGADEQGNIHSVLVQAQPGVEIVPGTDDSPQSA